MKQPVKEIHEIVEPKVNHALPMAELRRRKARKNIFKPSPLTPKPTKTIG